MGHADNSEEGSDKDCDVKECSLWLDVRVDIWTEDSEDIVLFVELESQESVNVQHCMLVFKLQFH